MDKLISPTPFSPGNSDENATDATNPAPIRIMVVERVKLAREGLRSLMAGNPRFQLVAETDSPAESLQLIEREKPDVTLLASELGEEKGLAVLAGLVKRHKGTRVLLMTQEANPEEEREALLLGAAGVVPRDAGFDTLLKAIGKVHNGEIWFERVKIWNALKEIQRNGDGDKPDANELKIDSLTHRENEVIALVCKGLKNREIGEKLFISETTVRHHLTSVFAKLECPNRLALIIFALDHGLATLPDTPKKNHRNYNVSIAGFVAGLALLCGLLLDLSALLDMFSIDIA